MLTLILAALLPVWEMDAIRATARACGLDAERTALLVAIRRAENGVPPQYFGVADRRANTYAKQVRYAAVTLRRRYAGDLDAFARRWCPFNSAVWARNVRFFMHVQGYFHY